MNKQENPFWSIILNVVVPAIILYYFSDDKYLGPKVGFVLAFSFPLSYGLYDFINRKRFNFISALGVVNVLLTGGIGLLEIDNHWLAVKEASIPAIIGLFALISLKTKYPLIRTILYNDLVMNTERINAELERSQNTRNFDSLLSKSTIILSASFFLSSFLNFVLAKSIVISPPGSPGYNQELGRMTLLSYPVIVVPSMIVMGFTIWYLFHGIKRLTDLNLEQILRTGTKPIEE